MNNEEYLDRLGTAKWLLHDQPVDENTAEFYPPESTEHPKCAELRYFAKGRLNLEFIGIITAKSLVSKFTHTDAWFEMGASGLQDIVRLWGDNNEDDYPQINKIIGTGTEKFMVLVEWCEAVWGGAETRKDEEVEKHGVKRLERWLKEHSCADEHIKEVTDDQFLHLTDILNVNDIINTHIKKYHTAEIGKCEDGHYLMMLDGGNNGQPHWHSYLEQIQSFLVRLHNSGYKAWIVEIENDCPDDTHQVILGFREQNSQTLMFKVHAADIEKACTFVYGWCERECMCSDYRVSFYLADDHHVFTVHLIYKAGEWHNQSSLNSELESLKKDLKELFGDKVVVSEFKEVHND